MNGFIIYPTYRIIANRAYICLFGRLENGESFLTLSYFKPYFYIKEKDLKEAQKIEIFETQKTDFKTFNNEPTIKIIKDLPKEVSFLRSSFEENNIETFEADIRFSYRFMIDNNLQGSIDIQGDYKTESNIDRVYKEPVIKSSNYFPKLKILSLDIETNQDASELYCISLTQDKNTIALIKSNDTIPNTISCKTEEELLEKFKENLLELDPDIITGWNLIDFDLKILQNKFKQYKIPFQLGRDNFPCKIKIESNFFRDSKADFPGRIIIDALSLLRTSFIKIDDYKLDSVASQILNDKKLISFKDKANEIENLYYNNPKKLIEYNQKDTQLVLRILEKTKALELSIKRSLLTGMPIDRVGASIASLDSLYIKKTKEKKLVVPTSHFQYKEREITGGYVQDSIPGIYNYIIILDFKSLYPSIIRTFNIDPSSFIENCKNKNVIKAPNGACFKNTTGILPLIIEEIWQHREKARKQKDELTRYALKILMNSFFGVMASPNCRFFNLKIANAITHFAQHIIKLTSKKIKEQGYEVIYSDTDSLFIVSKAKSLEEANKIGKKLQIEINEFYKTYIQKEYNRKSYLEFEYEKCFIKFLMPKIRHSEIGAKKRYAGLLIKNNKERIEFTGLEAKRSDWTELSKKFQLELYNKIFHDKNVFPFINKFVKDLNAGKCDNMLIYKKSLRKPVEQYTATTPPHIKAIRKLPSFQGKIIEYVITKDGPEHINSIKHKIDYKHYIDKQLKPIADSILSFFESNFDEIIQGSKQTDLFNFKQKS